MMANTIPIVILIKVFISFIILLNNVRDLSGTLTKNQIVEIQLINLYFSVEQIQQAPAQRQMNKQSKDCDKNVFQNIL